LNASNIPEGLYCYKYRERKADEPEFNEAGLPIRYVEYCPFYGWKEIGGVEMPWCSFLNQGGYDNIEYSKGELESIRATFKTQKEHDDALPLFLLWDGCKECGQNYGDI
jgi:hypothetical protein